MGDFYFYILVWIVTSLAWIAKGRAFLQFGNYIRPHGRGFRGFAIAFFTFGIFGLATIFAGLTLDTFGTVTRVRTIAGTVFLSAVAIAMNVATYRLSKASKEEQRELVKLYESIARLERTVGARK